MRWRWAIGGQARPVGSLAAWISAWPVDLISARSIGLVERANRINRVGRANRGRLCRKIGMTDDGGGGPGFELDINSICILVSSKLEKFVFSIGEEKLEFGAGNI